MTNWLITSLFWLGLIFIPVGLALILVPGKVLTWGNSVNRWISTTLLFESLDRPRNHERFYYRHHHLVGLGIAAFSIFSLYMLVFYAGVEATTAGLARLSQSPVTLWLLETGYYILTALCMMTSIVGLVILVRPSLLKSIETWGNRWIDTQQPLQRFDSVHDIPLEILPGNPRLFGFFVLLGAVYIVYATGTRIF